LAGENYYFDHAVSELAVFSQQPIEKLESQLKLIRQARAGVEFNTRQLRKEMQRIHFLHTHFPNLLYMVSVPTQFEQWLENAREWNIQRPVTSDETSTDASSWMYRIGFVILLFVLRAMFFSNDGPSHQKASS